jgi:hypothetical protein
VIGTDTEIGRHWPVVTAFTVAIVETRCIIRSTIVIGILPAAAGSYTFLTLSVTLQSVIRSCLNAVSIALLVVGF